ncbi:MAG: hypothetical protein WBB43_01680 [Limnoraphis sp.]
MKKLLNQLNKIEAIVDTVTPSQIEQNPQAVTERYKLYAQSYDPLSRVITLRDCLINEISQEKSVNGYLSADYGYGKTATLVYLWYECQQNQIVAVPPFKFKELGNLVTATYSWLKFYLPSEFQKKIDDIYQRYCLNSREVEAEALSKQIKLSKNQALEVVQFYENRQTDLNKTDNVLSFWQESVSVVKSAGFKGLAVFADESQEFLRTEEGSSVRIQILSDLVKGMRALGSTPVALILSMPTDPTESAIEEQAGDIIHRMKEQKVSLRLADAYSSDFPSLLWNSLCEKFLDKKSQYLKLEHSATIESLGQLCGRKDLSNGPRTTVEILKRLVGFVKENKRSYTPLDLIDDYLEGRVQFYGSQQHLINNVVEKLLKLPSVQNDPKGQDIIKLLAVFPSGVSESIAKELGLLESLLELVDDDNLYGIHVIQLAPDRYGLIALSQPNTPTVVDLILNQFRQRWFRDWTNAQKEEGAEKNFRSEILPQLFPASRSGQKANWIWRYSSDQWKDNRFGFFNFIKGAPEKYNADFPGRSIVISVGTENSNLMSFMPPEETHLDWRFYLNYVSQAYQQTSEGNQLQGDREGGQWRQKLTAIAGTGQVDFYLHLNRSFDNNYPTSFGLLNKVIPPNRCSACTLLNLSSYILDWLNTHSDVSKADQERLQFHRRECHQYAIKLLFPESQSWSMVGLENVEGSEIKLLESVFYQKCRDLFPEYNSFYNNLSLTRSKYKPALEQVSPAIRRGHQLYQVLKPELEKLFSIAGSGLPSLLGTLRKCNLIDEYNIAGKKEEYSQVKFTQHPLELFILNRLKTGGKEEVIQTLRGQESVQVLDYSEILDIVKRLGYLAEELEEAIEWLQLRRYVEWDRQAKIIYQAVIQLDPDDLKGQLNTLNEQVGTLLNSFPQEKTLQEVQKNIEKNKKSLDEISSWLMADNNSAQLNIFKQETVSKLGEEKSSLIQVELDNIQRKIQSIEEQLEEFCRGKSSEYNQELGGIKLKLENLTRDLSLSKVSQPILGHSGLETCLEEHRENLEKQVKKLDQECRNLTQSILADESDLLTLSRHRDRCYQSLKRYENTKVDLQELVYGLEKWRIILTRAEGLRERITDNSEYLERYDSEFIDRVVTYFDTHKIESFREYKLLRTPLVELEEQESRERRSRRDDFNHLLNQYEKLLEQISANKPTLVNLCRFDDEERQGSYQTLKRVFLDKVQVECDRILSQWDKLERDLIFLAQEREQDVAQLLEQVNQAKTQLRESTEKLPGLIEDVSALEEEIANVRAIASEGEKLQVESIQLADHKDENLGSVEKQLLDRITSLGDKISISQLCQFTSGSDRMWEQVRTLYRKGYLDITVKRRE